jgi:quercetin dioxygenase-like cupin family protein
MNAIKKPDDIPAEKVSGHNGFLARLLFTSGDKKTVLRLLDIAPGAVGPVPAHSHPDAHFFIVMEGALEVDLEGQTLAVQAGSCVEIAPNLVHQLRCAGKDPLKVLALKCE